MRKHKSKKRFDSKLDYIIGDCGSGKSCLAAAYARKYINKGYPVYTNFYLDGAFEFSISDFMKYDFGLGAVVIMDEIASNGLAARGNLHVKSNSQDVVEYFTTYRHYKFQHIFVISPSFQDCIPVVRNRINKIIVCKVPVIVQFLLFTPNIILFLLQKPLIQVTLHKYIKKKIDIVGEHGKSEPQEVYSWIPLKRGYTIQNLYYRYFDSFTQKPLQQKKWPLWNPNPKVKISLISKLFSILKSFY